MPKMKFCVVVYLLFLSFLNVSESDRQGLYASGSEPVNLIVILDTSDRISTQEQVDNDIEIATEIVTLFDKLVHEHLGKIPFGEKVQYPHRLSFVVPDQPTTPAIPPNIMRNLELWDPGRKNVHNEFVKQRDTLLAEIPKVYNFARKHKQTGSDIWDWFQSEANDYFCEGYQNLIICLSDGYLIFDDNIQSRRPEGTYMHIVNHRRIGMSKPLLPVDTIFSNYSIKFLMLEIDMKNDGDFENVKKYWKTWLNAIGIKKTDFAKQGRWLRKIQSFIPAK